jgi:hypothetical protein
MKAKELAFSAHTGDIDARKKLDKHETDAIKQATEIAGLECAVATAKGHVAAAEAADVDEAEREKALTALALLNDFSKRGEQLDSALEKFVREYDQLVRDARALEQTGFPVTTVALMRINMRAATMTKLMFGDLQVEHLAPNARRSFVETVEAWSRSVRGRATARLNKNAAVKAA